MDEKFTISGDTLINDQQYKKLFFHKGIPEFTPSSLTYWAAMREDTLNRKIYFVWNNHDEEVLLYDFLLEQGDPFHANSPFYGLSGPSYFSNHVSHSYI